MDDNRRIVIKLGTTLMTGGDSQLNLEILSSLVKQITSLHRQGYQIIIVASGAVAAGRHSLNSWTGNTDTGNNVRSRQIMASIGQGILMHHFHELFKINQVLVAQALLTYNDISDRISYLNIRNLLLDLTKLRIIPIVNENDVVAVDELEGDAIGDNDTLSALVANIIDADLLMLLGDLEGLYSEDPHLNPKAKLINLVESIENIEAQIGDSWTNQGRGGMITKINAAKLATAAGTLVIIANGLIPNVLQRIISGEKIGTRFTTRITNQESRKQWLLSREESSCNIQVDASTAKSLTEKGESLLLSGIISTKGSFARGEIIRILDNQSNKIAIGMVNYTNVEIDAIISHGSKSEISLLKKSMPNEVIHHNNMAITGDSDNEN
jgi:glutamate 5-kinase